VHHLAIGREDREGARAVEMVDAAGIGQQAVEAALVAAPLTFSSPESWS